MIQASTMANAMNQTVMRNDLLDQTAQKLQTMAKGPMTAERAKQVATEFESMFIGQMLEHMLSGESMGDSLFGSSESDEIYQGMMVEQYSKAITRSGGIGIAQHIERTLIERSRASAELLKLQEIPHEPAA